MYRKEKLLDAVARRLAWWLPRRVAKWAAVRVAVHATGGPYSGTIVPELTALGAIQRWHETDPS